MRIQATVRQSRTEPTKSTHAVLAAFLVTLVFAAAATQPAWAADDRESLVNRFPRE